MGQMCARRRAEAQADARRPELGERSRRAAAELKTPRSGRFDRSQFVADHPGDVSDLYVLEQEPLGTGTFGSVRKATKSGQSPDGEGTSEPAFAVKTIKKTATSMERLVRELAIMRILDHPNIVKVYESFEDRQNVYLVMELCTGGELFDRIVELDHFSETQAATVMQQIFRIMFYLHEQHVTHRDVKPENFLFQTKEPIETAVLKIIDFGLSSKFEPGKLLTSKSGTIYYVAPEVLSRGYNQMSDMWSCGCLVYVLLCGYPPFYAQSEDDDDIMELINKGTFEFKAADWGEVSEDAKSLITSLLTFDPKQRCSAEDALNHDWVKDKAPRARPVAFTVSIVDKLRKFNSAGVLKKAALHIIASHVDSTRIDKLREAFTSLDSKGNGLLTLADIKKGLEDAGFADVPDLQRILEGMTDGSGIVDYTEFIASTLDRKVFLEESACWTAFRVLDRDGDGRITTDDLRAVIGAGEGSELGNACGADSDSMAELMQEVDENGDGEIDFDEFMTMMRGRSGSSLMTPTHQRLSASEDEDEDS